MEPRERMCFRGSFRLWRRCDAVGDCGGKFWRGLPLGIYASRALVEQFASDLM